MKGGFQTNERAARIFLVTPTSGHTDQGKSHTLPGEVPCIIDLRRASQLQLPRTVNQLAQANLNTPLAVDTSKQQVQSLKQITIATKTDKQLAGVIKLLLKLVQKGGSRDPMDPPLDPATDFKPLFCKWGSAKVKQFQPPLHQHLIT